MELFLTAAFFDFLRMENYRFLTIFKTLCIRMLTSFMLLLHQNTEEHDDNNEVCRAWEKGRLALYAKEAARHHRCSVEVVASRSLLQVVQGTLGNICPDLPSGFVFLPIFYLTKIPKLKNELLLSYLIPNLLEDHVCHVSKLLKVG